MIQPVMALSLSATAVAAKLKSDQAFDERFQEQNVDLILWFAITQ